MKAYRLIVADLKNAWAGFTCAGKTDRTRGFIFLLLLIAFFFSAEYLSHRLFTAFLTIGGLAELIALVLVIRIINLVFLIVLLPLSSSEGATTTVLYDLYIENQQ